MMATSPADLLPLAEAVKMTGLEFMRGILDGSLPQPPIGGALPRWPPWQRGSTVS